MKTSKGKPKKRIKRNTRIYRPDGSFSTIPRSSASEFPDMIKSEPQLNVTEKDRRKRKRKKLKREENPVTGKSKESDKDDQRRKVFRKGLRSHIEGRVKVKTTTHEEFHEELKWVSGVLRNRVVGEVDYEWERRIVGHLSKRICITPKNKIERGNPKR